MSGDYVYIETLAWTEYLTGAGVMNGHPAGEIITVPPDIARHLVDGLGVAKYSTREAAEAKAAAARTAAETARAAQEGGERVAVRLKRPHGSLNVGEVGFFDPARAAELVSTGVAEHA